MQMHLLDFMTALHGFDCIKLCISVGHFFEKNLMKVITSLTAKEHMTFDVAIVADQTADQQITMSRIKRLNTEQLFTNVKEVMIEHLNETYILRITKQNKLILTK